MTTLGKYDVPVATRATRPGWRDPRLWVGVAIVAASVVAGARLLGSADDSVAVWAVAADMTSGQPVTTADVVVQQVSFGSAADAERYLSASEPIPDGTTLGRDVGAGELLPRAALGAGPGTSLQQLTFEFPNGGVSTGIIRGDTVDVWVVGAGGRTTEVVLDDVPVLEVTRGPEGFGSSGGRQVTVGVAEDADLERAVAGAHGRQVYLVEQGD